MTNRIIVGLSGNNRLTVNQGLRFWSRRFLWTPSEIATVAWHDASDSSTITESGGAVSQWNDKSGNDQHFVQGTGSLQPTTGTDINGVSTLNFSNQYMVISSMNLPVSGNMAMHIMWAPLNLTVNNDYLFATDTVNFIRAQYKNLIPDELRYQGVAVTENQTVNQGDGPALNVGVWNFTDGSSQVYYDGTFIDETLLYPTKFDTGVDFYLGAGAAGAAPVVADIGEVIFTVDITDETRQKIEGYLCHKWGMASNLPESHPYRYQPPYAY